MILSGYILYPLHLGQLSCVDTLVDVNVRRDG